MYAADVAAVGAVTLGLVVPLPRASDDDLSWRCRWRHRRQQWQWLSRWCLRESAPFCFVRGAFAGFCFKLFPFSRNPILAGSAPLSVRLFSILMRTRVTSRESRGEERRKKRKEEKEMDQKNKTLRLRYKERKQGWKVEGNNH